MANNEYKQLPPIKGYKAYFAFFSFVLLCWIILVVIISALALSEFNIIEENISVIIIVTLLLPCVLIILFFKIGRHVTLTDDMISKKHILQNRMQFYTIYDIKGYQLLSLGYSNINYGVIIILKSGKKYVYLNSQTPNVVPLLIEVMEHNGIKMI